jgi:hypothetical protein
MATMTTARLTWRPAPLLGRASVARCEERSDNTPGGIGFPNAEQAIRITRTRTINSSGKTTRENHRGAADTDGRTWRA